MEETEIVQINRDEYDSLIRVYDKYYNLIEFLKDNIISDYMQKPAIEIDREDFTNLKYIVGRGNFTDFETAFKEKMEVKDE